MSLYDSTGLYDQSALTFDGQNPGVPGLPNVGVFIAFNDSPYVADPSWTEVTQYVRDIPSIRRARSDDWSTFTGSATLTLNNRDQRFNPYNASGPYYGKLLPRRQIKIVADAGEYTNLVTNPSFEVDTTNWTSYFTNISRVTTDFYSGTASCEAVTTNNSASGYVQFSSTAATITAGMRYTASCYVKNTAGNNRQIRLDLQFLRNDLFPVLTVTGTSTQVDIGGGWVRLSVSGIAPANATRFLMNIYTQITNRVTGNTTLIDGAMVTQTNVPVDYFDGSSVGCNWTGTANASSSYKSLLMPLFRGYIAGWPVEWSNNDEDSTVSIECFDALSLLADTNIPNDNSYAAIQTLNPIYWFRGNDADRSTTLPNIGSRSVSATGPFIGASPASSELALSKTLPVTKGIPFQSNVLYASTSYVTPSITGNSDTEISIAMWYSLVDNLNTYSTAVLRANLFAATAGAQIQTNGFIYAFSKRAGTLYETTSTIGGFANTDPHHVAVTCTGSTLKLYVDGRDVTGTVTSTFIGTTQAEQITIGSCAYQDCAVFNYALTATQVLSIYNAGNATIPETTSNRVQRITSSGLFPTALISTPASPQGTVSQISTGDAQLINEFDLVRNSEGGELYVSKDGVITFTERNSQLKGRSATTQAYFKDDGTALKYAGNFTLRYDADSVVNDLRYEITGDAVITATDATSVSAYGQASKNISTQLSTATDAQSLANSRLAIFDTPVPQVSPLEVGITRSASDWQNLLSLELLDQIEVTRTPKTGSVFSDRLLVNEISHSINPNEWSMQITGSARFSEWFTIDIDFIDSDRLIA